MKPPASVLEAQFQQQVVDLARTLGWRSYHTHDSRRSAPGFPDLVLVRERVVYVELKTATGKLRPQQKEWLRALLDAGAEVYLARPGELDALALILRSRDPHLGLRTPRAAADLRRRTLEAARLA